MATYFFLSTNFTHDERRPWTPPVDIYRTPLGWLLKFELAGIRMQDVSLRVSERSITLEGIRRDYMLEEGSNCYSMEISYNRFERRVDLPIDLDGARIILDYKDGILLVRIRLGSPEGD